MWKLALVALYAGLGRVPALNLPSPPTVMIAWLALPQAWRLARTQPRRDPETFAMLDAKTAQLHLLFGMLCIIGFWIAAYLQIP